MWLLSMIHRLFWLCICIVWMSSAQPPLAGGVKKSPVGAGRTPKNSEAVIIVGGGLAGLSAAIEAIKAGARVILVDKEKDLGGNSAKASSGINGCNTNAQKARGISDSVDKFYSDTMSAGDRENDQTLVDILAHESADAVNFLIEYGVDLSDINLCGGHSVPRTHWLPSAKEGKAMPVGLAIIKALKSHLQALQEEQPDSLEIRLNTPVVGLVTWNDYVTGVRFKNGQGRVEEITGKAVVLTTGGFSSDHDNETSLLSEFASEKMSLPTTNGAFATGDGVKMARAMGAAVIGMEHVQVHPTAFIDPKNPTGQTKFLAAEALRGKGAILLNQKGKRFGNELGRRDYMTAEIYKHCAKNPSANGWHTAFMLMNAKSAEGFGLPAFNFYSKIKGFFKEVENVDKLAEYIKCDKTTLTKTLEHYNGLVQDYLEGREPKDSFGKTVFPVAFSLNEPFYLAEVTPAVHYTMGGLKIDRQAFVYSEFMEKPFKGLLAAGEVSGGVHGRNRLAGNSLLECVVFELRDSHQQPVGQSGNGIFVCRSTEIGFCFQGHELWENVVTVCMLVAFVAEMASVGCILCVCSSLCLRLLPGLAGLASICLIITVVLFAAKYSDQLDREAYLTLDLTSNLGFSYYLCCGALLCSGCAVLTACLTNCMADKNL